MKSPNQWMFDSSSAAEKDSRPGMFKETAYQVFKFFASVKLAIPLLTLLMIVLAVGTVIESLQGAEAAKILVYDASWFSVLLLFLGINILSATLDRLPWKKKHIGFVVTHLGLITILVGSLVTQAAVIDGQMPIAEGETESFITLPEPILYVFSQELGEDWIFPIEKKPFAWEGRQPLRTAGRTPFSLNLLHYYPKARVHESLEPAQSGPAAVKLKLRNSFLNQEQWLVEKDPRKGAVQMGPAKLVFTDQLLKENAQPAPSEGYLEFEFSGRSVPVPLSSEMKLPAVLPIEGTEFQITITRMLRNAVVSGKELVEEPRAAGEVKGPGKNPAVEFTLEGPGLREKHTVFSKYPDFPTVHGMKPSAAGVRVYYRMPDSGSAGESHELRFVRDEGEGLMYQIKDGFQVRTGRAVPGADVETGWMDLKFRVDQFYPHSKTTLSYEPHPNTSEAEDLVSAVEVELQHGKGTQRVWLTQGVRSKFESDGVTYQMIYGQRRIPLGFKIELKDFKIEHYPGTSQPARFSSDVVLKDDMQGIVRDVHVTMNEPLEHRGFKLYQSAYSIIEGQPEISIFSVGRDPGIPIKYAGSIILIGGIVTMFSMRRFKKKEMEKV